MKQYGKRVLVTHEFERDCIVPIEDAIRMDAEEFLASNGLKAVGDIKVWRTPPDPFDPTLEELPESVREHLSMWYWKVNAT